MFLSLADTLGYHLGSQSFSSTANTSLSSSCKPHDSKIIQEKSMNITNLDALTACRRNKAERIPFVAIGIRDTCGASITRAYSVLWRAITAVNAVYTLSIATYGILRITILVDNTLRTKLVFWAQRKGSWWTVFIFPTLHHQSHPFFNQSIN